MIALESKNVSYRYKQSGQDKEVLSQVSASFDYGTVYAIMGRSGSGKSTFLSLLAGLDRPDSGQVYYHGNDLASMDESAYRREKVGVIYQDYGLFPLLTVLENIMYPLELVGIRGKEAMDIATQLAKQVGLDEKLLDRFPSAISGGEQQRVAIARAISLDRKIILADEPTGNLDFDNCTAILDILRYLAHKENYCVIIVTHDPEVIQAADVVLQIEHGQIRPRKL